MNILRLTVVVLLLGVSFCSAASSRGDEILQISGTVLTVGNNATNCSPNPCAIVTNFSAQLQISDIPPDVQPIYVQGVPNSGTYTTISSLGNSSGVFDTFGPTLLFTTSAEAGGYFVIPGFPGEVDLEFLVVLTPAGFEFKQDGAFFYFCDSVCVQDFVLPQYQQIGVCYDLGCHTSPVEVLAFSATQVPEPSSRAFDFFVLSLLALILVVSHTPATHTRNARVFTQ
jgi:hypothetical protein